MQGEKSEKGLMPLNSMMTSRGCNHKCSYCANASFYDVSGTTENIIKFGNPLDHANYQSSTVFMQQCYNWYKKSVD